MLVSGILLAHIIQIKFSQHHKIQTPSITRVVSLLLHILLSELNGGVLEVLNTTMDDVSPSWNWNYFALEQFRPPVTSVTLTTWLYPLSFC